MVGVLYLMRGNSEHTRGVEMICAGCASRGGVAALFSGSLVSSCAFAVHWRYFCSVSGVVSLLLHLIMRIRGNLACACVYARARARLECCLPNSTAITVTRGRAALSSASEDIEHMSSSKTLCCKAPLIYLVVVLFFFFKLVLKRTCIVLLGSFTKVLWIMFGDVFFCFGLMVHYRLAGVLHIMGFSLSVNITDRRLFFLHHKTLAGGSLNEVCLCVCLFLLYKHS